jgi:hypothetical protein
MQARLYDNDNDDDLGLLAAPLAPPPGGLTEENPKPQMPRPPGTNITRYGPRTTITLLWHWLSITTTRPSTRYVGTRLECPIRSTDKGMGRDKAASASQSLEGSEPTPSSFPESGGKTGSNTVGKRPKYVTRPFCGMYCRTEKQRSFVQVDNSILWLLRDASAPFGRNWKTWDVTGTMVYLGWQEFT